MTRRSTLLLLVLALVATAPPLRALPKYAVTGIGALADDDPSIPTPPTSAARAINDWGVVTGDSWISGGCIETGPGSVLCERIVQHAVIWEDGLLRELGPPAPGLAPMDWTSIGWAIDDDGRVAGEYTWSLDPYRHAFVSHDAGPLVELPPLIPGDARAWDLNERGTVVGESDAEGTLTYHAVAWTRRDGAWSAEDLGTLGGATSTALGVNAHDEITGWSMNGNRQTTFLRLPKAAYGLPAGMHDITPGLAGTAGEDINSRGEVVGRAGFAPMIWLPEAAHGLPEGVTVFPASAVATEATLDSLGAVQVLNASFTAINDSSLGTVEAWFEFPDGAGGTYQARYGMLWFRGQFVLLEQVADMAPSWLWLAGAADVNELGAVSSTGETAAETFLGAIVTPTDWTIDGPRRRPRIPPRRGPTSPGADARLAAPAPVPDHGAATGLVRETPWSRASDVPSARRAR